MTDTQKDHRPGLGVDSTGNPVVDPTANVLQLVSAAMLRQDDLRIAERRRIQQLMKAEQRRIDQQLRLRAEYDSRLIEAEAKRIDAIRSVDTNAVTVAAARAQDQATVLANQLNNSAETLRALVESNRSSVANQLTQIITPITDRLAVLEKAQYEGAGKERVTDPLMSQLLIEMKAIRESSRERTGQSMGSTQALAWILAAIGIAGFLITLALRR